LTWLKVKLSDVAPAKPLKIEGINGEQQVWQVTLSHIESNTGKLVERNIQPYSMAGSSTHWFDEQHVLYSKLRPYLNKVLLPPQKGVGTTELVPMLPDAKRLNRKFLAYYLRSKGFVNWVSTQTAGAKMPRVSMKVFWEHKIPLPPLAEQKKIAAILDAADRLRQKDAQLIAKYNALSQSLFLDMFGDPVTNPMGLNTTNLSSITEFENGDRSSNYPSGDDIKSDGVLFLSTKNIRNQQLDLSFSQFISEEKFNALSRGKAKRGDLLITLRGTLGSCSLFNTTYETAFINAQMMIIRPTDKVNPVYLHALITSEQFNKMLQSIGAGAAVPQLTATQLKKLSIISPSIIKQKQFAERIQHIEVQKQQAQASLQKSEDLFNSLLQRAFKGELTT